MPLTRFLVERSILVIFWTSLPLCYAGSTTTDVAVLCTLQNEWDPWQWTGTDMCSLSYACEPGYYGTEPIGVTCDYSNRLVELCP